MSDCPKDLTYRPPYTVEGEDLERPDDCLDPVEDLFPSSSSSSSEDSYSGSESRSSLSMAEEISSFSDNTASDGDGNEIPTFTLEQLSILCADIGLSPEMIEGVIAQLLIGHFSDPQLIIHQACENMIWTPGSDTGIWIQPSYNWNSEQDGKLPAIYYKVNAQQQLRLTIGDQFYQIDDREGFVRGVTGSHTLHCFASSDYVTNQLATEVEKWVTTFSQLICKKLPFHDFQVTNRGELQKQDAFGERMGVALTLNYVYLWAWETQPAGPPLKSATIKGR